VELIDRCRKCDKVGKTTEHVIAQCSSLSESTYLRRHNQLAKIMHQHIATEYKLLDGHTALYYRYKPEQLESADTILYWDMAITGDKAVDFNRPDTVLFDRQNKTALVIHIAVPLTHSLSRTEEDNNTIWKLGPRNQKYLEA
jgi:hypothetical protein